MTDDIDTLIAALAHLFASSAAARALGALADRPRTPDAIFTRIAELTDDEQWRVVTAANARATALTNTRIADHARMTRMLLGERTAR